MMEQQREPLSRPLVAGLVALAAALGFGASHWLASRNAPVAPAASTSGAAAPAAAAPTDNGVEVKIPSEYLAIAKIAVEPVGNGGLQAEILTAGTVAAPPNSEAVIVARASGTISRVNRQLGDTIRAGDTLAQVASLEAATMAAERSVANAKAELARKNYARESSLFAQGVTPRQEMEAAQSELAVAETELQRSAFVAKAAHVAADGKSVSVVSPINGKITAQMATLGGFVQPQTELFRVAGDGQVQVEASLPVADIGRVAVGDRATIVASSGAPVEATVRSVTPTVSGSTRAATVVLTPVGPVRALVVGEGVQARLHVKNGAAGLVVPEDAVQNVNGHDVLFVRTKDGFRAQPVLVGTRSGGVAQIVSGVAAGQQVATRNAFLVKADMIKSAKDE
ncbi:efflux RND transporter periplasmic adaptor subunit [Duganella violaceipulchra]|uniref:Cobalt-zinc-cadmium efflux system membrane fusion protein n=1 Tax=Duganella violaceipulchra TaxID=2849652 RepID=A0AA41HAM4_9BURK|nr:efflux RND transporter periplasmic adaptor subunit [Duganella violaceicalia]MBV6323759.1 efflux RND transporter periplasmic adaptor subunit [Duganella violaceicalia]MCP2007449.1 cobalt-zinc-cadmium efflux system membrane fusion protein [Duganella violaceicalia]